MKIAPEISDSLELRFSKLARKKNTRGESIISLGLGEPAFPTPAPIIQAATQAMQDGYTRYSNPLGLQSLREKIVAKLDRENGITTTAEEIIVTPGAKMALSLALSAILKPGDEVINISPCYPSYFAQFKIAEPDCIVHNVNLRQQDLSLDINGIASKLGPKTRAVVLNFPHNPTGRILHEPEIKALVDILSEHHCYVISDEIYERLNHSGAPFVSFASYPALAKRTLTINGFSKAFSMTGWRIGYLVVPEPQLMTVVSRLQQHLNTNTATFVQKAAEAALDLPPDHLESYNRDLAKNSATLQAMTARTPSLRVGSAEGGLFAFMNISGCNLDSDTFALQLLEKEGVAAIPGITFGAEWDRHLRISLATDPASFTEGVARIERFANDLTSV